MEPTTNFGKLPDRAPTAKKVAFKRRKTIDFHAAVGQIFETIGNVSGVPRMRCTADA
jgi:hypothetical protein